MKAASRLPGLEVSVRSLRNVGRYSQIVRLVPTVQPLPSYIAGQHLRLLRERDQLEKYFSIASSPSDTTHEGYIELYVAGEMLAGGGVESIDYFFDDWFPNQRYALTSISGGFTLTQNAGGYDHIVMISTGTGIAPFRSMVREMIASGQSADYAVTLLHSHLSMSELVYHDEFTALTGQFDFLYIPSLTRAEREEFTDPGVSRGRVSALLRMIVELPGASYGGTTEARLAPSIDRGAIARRFRNRRTIIMACGNPAMLDEIKEIAAQCDLQCVGEG